MSGAQGDDLTRVVLALQELTKAAYLTQQTLKYGVTVNTQLPTYTVATLPAAPASGLLAYATNGRNTGEGAAAGTGTMVMGNGSIWRAVWSGSVVLA